MLDQRLQILVSADQRRRLEAAARATNRSVGAVIRDAVERELAGPSSDRLDALERLLRRAPEPMPPPDELRELIDGRFDG